VVLSSPGTISSAMAARVGFSVGNRAPTGPA
jgi:hypothetical protein